MLVFVLRRIYFKFLNVTVFPPFFGFGMLVVMKIFPSIFKNDMSEMYSFTDFYIFYLKI